MIEIKFKYESLKQCYDNKISLWILWCNGENFILKNTVELIISRFDLKREITNFTHSLKNLWQSWIHDFKSHTEQNYLS